MRYQKPELVELAPAIRAVQNPSSKSEMDILDNVSPPSYATAAAYPADE